MVERKKAAAYLLSLQALDEDESQKNGNKTRRIWIRRRGSLGIFNLIQELGIEDSHGYREIMRMNEEQFQGILQLIDRISPNKLTILLRD